MAAPKQTFPNAPISEMIEFLRELGVVCSQEDLREPKPPKVREMFERIIEFVFCAPRDEYAQPKQQCIEALEVPELHEMSIGEVSFLRNLIRLMHNIGVPSFSVNDLTTPDWRRLRLNLSAVINFLKFREQRLQKYTELSAVMDEREAERAQAEAELREATDRVASVRARLDSDAARAKELEEDAHALERRANELNEQQAALRTETASIKTTSKDVEVSISQLEVEIAEHRLENNKLRTQVVLDPESLKKMLKTLAARLDSERAEADEQEKKTTEIQQRSEQLVRHGEDLLVAIKTLESIETDIKRVKDLQAQLKEKEAREKKKSDDLRHLQTTESNMKQMLDKKNERLASVRARSEEKKKVIAKITEELKADRAQAEIKRNEAQNALGVSDAEVRKIQAMTQQLQQDHDAEMDRLKSTFDHLTKQVHSYHHKLALAMQ